MKELHLAHIKVNSKNNADLLGQLIARKLPVLETVYLEEMYAKRTLLLQMVTNFKRMVCQNTLQSVSVKQEKMNDNEIVNIAS